MTQRLLAGTDWVRHTRSFARSLRGAGHRRGGLLLVGTPVEEPWHLTAHLDDEARLGGIPELTPTLVRHQVEPDAPRHLAIDLGRLAATGRGETVFVVAPGEVGEVVLERVDDARRAGATVLALESGDRELRSLAHDALTVGEGPAVDSSAEAGWSELMAAPATLRPDGLVIPHHVGLAFETAQHLVSVAAGETPTPVGRRRGFRDRLARLLDGISGPDDETEPEDPPVGPRVGPAVGPAGERRRRPARGREGR